MSSISSLCAALQTSTTHVVDGLRNFVTYYPQARLDLASLSRELAELQMVARLLHHNAQALESGSAPLPGRLDEAIKGVVSEAGELLEEADDALDTGRTAEERTPSWLEHTAERAINSQPHDGERELPGYSSSQILQEASTIRSRFLQESDSEDPRVESQRSIIAEFIEATQDFISESSSAAPPPIDDAESRDHSNSSIAHPETIASSPHSETNEPPIPDYNAIGITSTTPLRISLRHLAKKELSNHEVVETAYVSRHNAPTIAISTLESPTRFYDTSANQVSCLQNQHGVNMIFSRNGRQWAYLSEEDGKGLNAASHDGINFKKPVVYLGDYINGRKLAVCKWPGGKPLAFSQDGNWLAVGSTRGRVGLMDCSANLNKASVVIPCHMDEVTHAVFTPDSKLLITQSRDGTIRITNVETRASIAKLETDTWKKPVFLGTSPDGEVIVSLWGDTVFHWNHGTAALESYNLSGRRTREGWPIAVSADCRFLCCRTDDGVDSGFVTAASFSWDGKYLILGKAASWMGLKMGTSTLDVWELVF
ncbi:ribosome assembly 4 [Fusarium denticulatum]|uniref:Mitochondrial division protein 1 n=1 Tax=Fusarium denticulatum TaxID=48507 RepID=A0A8H5XEG8_9HYPO|nr:ribosome assembly 4 [Fusarium denticulatum]